MNCSHLVIISLYGNMLQGEIPSEVSSLHNLAYLYLDENRLTGKIPSSIGSLVSLKELVLQFNNLEHNGHTPREIHILVDQNTKHPATAGSTRLHYLEVDA